MSAQDFSALLLNLDRDTTRLDHMREQLGRAHIKFTRLQGILGDAVPADLKPYFFDSQGQAKTTMKRGEIGCYASHLRALKRIAMNEFGEAVLVMEDDLDIAQDLIDIIDAARRAAADGWDILRLSNPPRRAYAPVAQLSENRLLVCYSKIPNSAGAYLVTPAGAQKFLQLGMRGLTFDDDLRRPWFHHMKTLGVVPPPVCAGVMNQSSIDMAEAGRFDKGMSSRMERITRGDHWYVFKRVAYNIRMMGPTRWFACSIINIVDMLAKPFLGYSIIHRALFVFARGRKHV